MKCERCNQNEATVFYEESINGQKSSRHLCAACAAQAGLSSPHILFHSFSPIADMQNDLFKTLFGQPQVAKKAGGKTCAACGAVWSDLLAKGKACCPECYRTFGEELEGTLRSLHGNVTHTGRAPAGRRAEREKENTLQALQKDLTTAIAEERFEDAAALRDRIRALREEG